MFQPAMKRALIHRDENAIMKPVRTGAKMLLIKSIRRIVAFFSMLKKEKFVVFFRFSIIRNGLLAKFSRSDP